MAFVIFLNEKTWDCMKGWLLEFIACGIDILPSWTPDVFFFCKGNINMEYLDKTYSILQDLKKIKFGLKKQ